MKICQTEDETLKPTSCFICSSADICIEWLICFLPSVSSQILTCPMRCCPAAQSAPATKWQLKTEDSSPIVPSLENPYRNVTCSHNVNNVLALSFAQFVYFLRKVCLIFNFWTIKFTIMSDKTYHTEFLKSWHCAYT